MERKKYIFRTKKLPKILVFDNYDSFTYNLVQMIEIITGTSDCIDVFRNDEISLKEINKYDKIIISPGPGIPSEAGILLEMIKKYAQKKEILGICLGQQAIAEAFGGELINLSETYHGVATKIYVINEDKKILDGLPIEFEAGRYHSWVVSDENFPKELEITALDSKGMIMALKHKTYDVHAVQFHPESILTPLGKNIIKNFILN